MTNLYYFYKTKIIYQLMKKFHYHSIMQVPRVKKITLNMGVGKAVSNKKLLDNAINNLSKLSGQKPITTIAKKSISSFKIRKGNAIGCKVTLRNKRMWDFLERFIIIVIPRIRDFRGLSHTSFDGYGNYNIGIRELIIFPEINYDNINNNYGLDISINTTAKSNNECHELLSSFNFPFRK